jgi:hypothetical protein
LSDLCFYDCPEPKIICGDFSKSLGAAIVLKTQGQYTTSIFSRVLISDIKGFMIIDNTKDLVLIDPDNLDLQRIIDLLDKDIIIILVQVW